MAFSDSPGLGDWLSGVNCEESEGSQVTPTQQQPTVQYITFTAGDKKCGGEEMRRLQFSIYSTFPSPLVRTYKTARVCSTRTLALKKEKTCERESEPTRV